MINIYIYKFERIIPLVEERKVQVVVSMYQNEWHHIKNAKQAKVFIFNSFSEQLVSGDILKVLPSTSGQKMGRVFLVNCWLRPPIETFGLLTSHL